MYQVVTTTILRVVIAAAGAQPGANPRVPADHPQARLFTHMEFLSSVMAQTRDSEDRIRYLLTTSSSLAPLESGTDTDRLEYAIMTTEVACRLRDEGRTRDALQLLDHLARSNVEAIHRQQALRLTGQILKSQNRIADAAEAFEGQLALMEANPDTMYSSGYYSGASQLAAVRRKQGRHQEAVLVYERVMNAAGPVALDVRQRAAQQRAVTLASAEGAQAACEAAAALLNEHPTWGLENGERLSFTAFYARQLRQAGRVEESVRVARSAWESAGADQLKGAIDVGFELIESLRQAGLPTDAMDVRAAVLATIDADEPRWSQRPLSSSIREKQGYLLMELSAAGHVGRPELALHAVERLLAREQHPANRADLIHTRDKAERAIRDRSHNPPR